MKVKGFLGGDVMNDVFLLFFPSCSATRIENIQSHGL